MLYELLRMYLYILSQWLFTHKSNVIIGKGLTLYFPLMPLNIPLKIKCEITFSVRTDLNIYLGMNGQKCDPCTPLYRNIGR